MWQKIFGTSNKVEAPVKTDVQDSFTLLEPKNWSPPHFDSDSMLRVVLCQDDSGGGKAKVTLFDSDQTAILDPNTLNISASARRSSNTVSAPPFVKQPRRYNLGVVGDMMFGTVPMSFKGTTAKLHPVSGPIPQVLITVLFSISHNDLQNYPTLRAKEPDFEVTEYKDKQIKVNPNLAQALAIPKSSNNLVEEHAKLKSKLSRSQRSVTPNRSDEESESNSSVGGRDGLLSSSPLTASSSPIGAPSYASSLSSFHNVHLDRRLKKSGLTSMENGVFLPTTLPTAGSRNSDELGSLKQKSPALMYALGLIINLNNPEDGTNTQNIAFAQRHRRDFVYTHYSLIESQLYKLHSVAREVLIRQLSQRHSYVSMDLDPFVLQLHPKLISEVDRFRKGFADLYLTPRIQEPLWLNMLAFPNKRAQYANSLLTELEFLVERYDTKATNWFLSTLLTTLLAHHLSWVPIVPAEFYQSEVKRIQLSYNPLWAQLSDLYGNVGNLTRACKTIVVGTDSSIVRRFLYIITYFIRCNDIVLNGDRNGFDTISTFVQTQSSNASVNISLNEPELASVRSSPTNTNLSTHDSRHEHSSNYYGLPEGHQQVPLPAPLCYPIFPVDEDNSDYDIHHLYSRSYGRSLLAAYLPEYRPGFVLQGVPTFDFAEQLESDLADMVKFPVDELVISGSAAIVADCSRNQIYVIEYHSTSTALRQVDGEVKLSENLSTVYQPTPSAHVRDSLDEVCRLFRFGLGAEACTQYLEDKLRQLHYRSLLLSSLLRNSEEPVARLDTTKLATMLSTDPTDLPLIMAMTSTYDPIVGELRGCLGDSTKH